MNIKKNIYIVADLRERKIAKFWRLYIYIYIYMIRNVLSYQNSIITYPVFIDLLK
jgi:hypothetical protein